MASSLLTRSHAQAIPARDYVRRAYTVSVTGSTESGKTTLFLELSRLLRDNYSIAVVTRKPAPDRDGSREFLLRHKALAASRIVAVDENSHLIWRLSG